MRYHTFITFCVFCILLISLQAQVQTLQNDHTRITLDASRHYSVTSLIEQSTHIEQIAQDKLPPKASPWELRLRKPDGYIVFLSALTPCDEVSVNRHESAITVTWQGLHHAELKGSVDFTMTVALRPDGATAWSCQTTGSTDAQLWQLQFPQLHALRSKGDDSLAVPKYLGRIWHNPATRSVNYTLSYPQPASMQFFAYWGTSDQRFSNTSEQEPGWLPDQTDATGVLFMSEDQNGYIKHLSANTTVVPETLSFICQNFPSLDIWPPQEGQTFPFHYSLPYSVVIKPFKGDIFTAAKNYADWARQQIWCSAGPIPVGPQLEQQTDTPIVHHKPHWFCNTAYWTKFYQEPYKVLADWEAFQSWLPVPSASHYYRYNLSVFDDNYPEHLPGKPYLINGMRAARRMHVYPQPYLNGVIWDTDTQSFINEQGIKAVREEADGSHRIWNINNEYFNYMCPATEQWQRKMRETVRKQVWEHDMAGVYLDCLAATSASLCHNPAHGHPARGGDYFTSGNRKLLYDLRRDIRSTTPEASFFTEEICEQYLDCLDGFLTLDFLRPGRLQPGEQLFPIFNLVYNPYVIDFGSDATLQQPQDFFALQMGLLYTWGCVPLLSNGLPAYPKQGSPNSELLKHIVLGYHTLGRSLTASAEFVRLSQRPIGSTLPASAIDVQSAPHQVTFTDISRQKHHWHGPSVVAGAFRQNTIITLLLCNLTTEKQSVVLTVTPQAFNGTPVKTAHLLWPQSAILNSETANTISLSPSETAIVIYSTDSAPSFPDPDKFLTKDWIFLRPTESGPFPTVPLSAEPPLLACDDATVHCTFAPTPQAHLFIPDDQGVMMPRQAVVPQKSSNAKHSQPRQRTGQPFALLRQLPITLSNAQSYRVIDGDLDYLSAVITHTPEQTPALKSDLHGILVCQRLNRQQPPLILPAARLSEAFSQALTELGPSDAPLLIGFTTCPPDIISELQRLSSLHELPADALVKAYDSFRTSPSQSSLTELSKAAYTWCYIAASYPELLAPDTPGHKLLRLVAALQFPLLNTITPPELIPEHDWLAPHIPKTIPFTGTLLPQDIIASGNWQAPIYITRPTDKPHEFILTITDATYIERMVPVTVWFPTTNGGLFPAITWLECNRPYELQTQPLPLPILSGATANASVTLRNWSPLPLSVTLQAILPEGLSAALPKAPTTLAPLSEVAVSIPITASTDANGGKTSFTVRANHLDKTDTSVTGYIPVEISECLRPCSTTMAAPDTHATPPRLRGNNTYLFYAHAHENVILHLTNKRVTIYDHDLTWEITDENRRQLNKGLIKVDKTDNIVFVPPHDGTFFLNCHSNGCASMLTSSSHALSLLSTPETRVYLFCDTITRFFYVRKQAKSFNLAVKDGGTDETAAIILESPTGRLALKRDGNWNGNTSIAVNPDETGSLWKLTVIPKQDVTFGLSGDVTPCLSPSPQSALKGHD